MRQFPVGVVSFAMSAVLNLSVLAGVNRSFYISAVEAQSQRVFAHARQENSVINFNYVESSKDSQKPKTKITSSKISDKDSAASDLYRNKPKTGNVPFIPNQGVTEQLAQRQSAVASPMSMAKPAKEAKTPGEVQQKKKIQTPAETMTDGGEILKKQTPQEELKQEEASQSQEFQKPQKKSDAAMKVDGSRGNEKISAAEMSRKPGAGANLFGVTSFEATGSGMGQYMKNLKEKIWLAWFPYLAFKYPMDFKTADAILSMTLDSSGNLKDVRIISFEGSEAFALFCVESVRRVENFGKIPPEILSLLGRDELEMKFAFHFK